MTTIGKGKLLEFAQTLRDRNAAGESWEAIAASYHDKAIKRGTLCSFANGKAKLPDAYLKPLGLVQTKEPEPAWRRQTKKAIRKMAHETKKAVLRTK